jgi:hypothetical protein
MIEDEGLSRQLRNRSDAEAPKSSDAPSNSAARSEADRPRRPKLRLKIPPAPPADDT